MDKPMTVDSNIGNINYQNLQKIRMELDKVNEKRQELNSRRNASILHLYHTLHFTQWEIADIFKIDRSAVTRIIEKSRGYRRGVRHKYVTRS